MNWWINFSLMEKICFCIATPSSVLILIMIVLMIFGIGGEADVDTDVDTDVSFDGDPSLALFSVKTVLSAFSIGGWIGFTLADVNTVLAIVCAIAGGIATLFIVALILKAIYGLQTDGNVDYKTAIGKTAEVYLTIPKKGEGSGKITLTIQDSFIEAEAVTLSDTPIKTGSRVTITALEGNTFTVAEI